MKQRCIMQQSAVRRYDNIGLLLRYASTGQLYCGTQVQDSCTAVRQYWYCSMTYKALYCGTIVQRSVFCSTKVQDRYIAIQKY